MKKFTFFVSAIICLLIVASCGNNSTDNTNNNSSNNNLVKKEQVAAQLEFKTKADSKGEFIVEETPTIFVSQKDTVSFDSIQFYFAKAYLETTTKLPFDIKINENNKKTGRINFEARVFKNGTTNIQKFPIRFLSDIKPKIYSYEVVRTYPHDKKAFTQGLVFENGFFFEATGEHGKSSIRKVQVGTGDVIQSYSVSPEIFGEGITIFGDKIIQLSWKANRGFVYDKKTFQLLQEFSYPTEGWGLTNDGKYLLMSDGSNKIYFLDTESYSEVSRIEVYDDKGIVDSLNELEFIDGEIYANVYQTDKIARIDPATGKVLSYIDLNGILSFKDRERDTDVLNGIAYDFENQKLFVTGKRWPKLFEIKLIEKK